MFTGIIEEVGKVMEISRYSSGMEMKVAARKVTTDLEIGHSVAVNGVCLTVTSFTREWFVVTAVEETLARTTLGELKQGDLLNLERSLRVDQRFHGHIVQGHVDAIGEVVALRPLGDNLEMHFKVPADILGYCVEKGSIAIDGISLTIAGRQGDLIRVAVIPHTLRNTNLATRRIGDKVNIETDIIGRYIRRFLSSAISDDEGLTIEKLINWGYGES